MEKFEKSEVKRILVGTKTLENLLNPELNPEINAKLTAADQGFNPSEMNKNDWERLSQILLPVYPMSILAPLEQFKPIICAYLNYPKEICLGYNKCTKLKGFNFDSADMLSLIDPQTYRPIPHSTGTEPKVHRIISLFGLRNGVLTMVYARVDGNNNLIEDWAFEYVDPCPDNCPNQMVCNEKGEYDFCKNLED